jgi:hypothetical protein
MRVRTIMVTVVKSIKDYMNCIDFARTLEETPPQLK